MFGKGSPERDPLLVQYSDILVAIFESTASVLPSALSESTSCVSYKEDSIIDSIHRFALSVVKAGYSNIPLK